MSDHTSSGSQFNTGFGPQLSDQDIAWDSQPPISLQVPRFSPTKNFKGGLNPPRTWEEGKRLGWDDESLDRLMRDGLIPPPNPLLDDLSSAPMSQRLEISFKFLDQHLPADMRSQLAAAAPWMAGTALVWAGGHFFGASEVVDMVLLTFGSVALGQQMLQLNDDLYAYFTMVENAQVVQDLDHASVVLARVINTVGIDVFLALIAGNKRVSTAKNRVAWMLEDLGRRHVGSRWPRALPNANLLPPEVKNSEPRSPIPLLTPQTRRIGGLDAVASAARKAGLTVTELEYIASVAAQHGINIYVRPAGSATPGLRAAGAIAKREWMKMNTINADDVAMGAPARQRGRVAHFKPRPWKEIEGKIGTADQARVKARWQQRMASYEKTNPDVQRNINSGKIRLDESGTLYDTRTGKPYTGDIDFFEYRGPDGRTLKPGDRLFNAVQNALERGPAFAQHHTHATWKPSGPFEEKIFADIYLRHGTVEPLVRVEPTGNVSLYYADLPMCWR